MIETAATQAIAVTVSVLSALLAGSFALRVIVGAGGRAVADRTANALHVIMAIAMLAMPWPWAPAPALQIVVFTAAAFWFAALAIFRPTSAAGLAAGGAARSARVLPAPADTGPAAGVVLATATVPRVAHRHHGHPVVLAYHAGMMLAMAWMGVAMLPQQAGDTAGMAGMSGMSGMSGTAAMTGRLPWAEPISVLLGVAFAIAALCFTVQLVRRASEERPVALLVADTASAALMAAVMSVSFLLLMT